MFSPSTSWYRSFSPRWHFATTTGKLNWSFIREGLLCSGVPVFCQLTTYFVAGTPHPCLSETLSATLQGWRLLLSASWDTSAKQCCCSSFLKWLTLSTPFLNFFTLYPVHDTAYLGNPTPTAPKTCLQIFKFHALKWFYVSLPFLWCHCQYKAESRNRQTADELL